MSTVQDLALGPARPARPGPEGAVGAATALLDAYRPGGTALFASPTVTLLAEGVAARVPHGPAPLAERTAATLRAARAEGGGRPVVIGAVPFDAAAPARLVVPVRAACGPPLAHDPLAMLPPPPYAAVRWRVRAVPEPDGYRAAVAEAVRRIRGADGAGRPDRLAKVVLARTLELTSPAPFDLPLMVRRLALRDTGGYTFAVPLADGGTLLGASPELLVRRRGGTLVANPLAGSVPRSADLAEDVRRAAGLLESAKDLHEHAVVVDGMRAALAPFCARLDVPARPGLVRTATMWHLSTTVTGRLRRPVAGALELALALHPTPAVCGTPTAAAREVIAGLEPFDRGPYAGLVGWQDADGDGEWAVTLRCAAAGDRSLRLYAGAGIVAQSQPDAELAETAAKFATFLSAVGAAHPEAPHPEAPAPVASHPEAPHPEAPHPEAPESEAPDPVASHPEASRPQAADPVAADSVAANSVAPDPAEPDPAAADAEAPDAAALDPEALQPEAPDPEEPDPAAPNAVAAHTGDAGPGAAEAVAR